VSNADDYYVYRYGLTAAVSINFGSGHTEGIYFSSMPATYVASKGCFRGSASSGTYPVTLKIYSDEFVTQTHTYTTNVEGGLGTTWYCVNFGTNLTFDSGSPYAFKFSSSSANILLNRTDVTTSDYVSYYNGSVESGVDSSFGLVGLPSMSITSSPTGTVSSGETVVYSGTCITNGTDQLVLVENAQNGLGQGYSDESNYNLDCVDNQWGTVSVQAQCTSESQINMFIIDKSWLDNQTDITSSSTSAYISNACIPTDSEWHIYLLSPQFDINRTAKLKADSAYQFHFRYQIPSSVSPDDVDFYLKTYTDDTFATVDSTQAQNSLTYFEPDANHEFTISVDIEDSTTYPMCMALEVDSAQRSRYCFVVTGSTDTDAQVSNPNAQDLGPVGNLLRTLFVPESKDFQMGVQLISDEFSTMIPFGYFYQVKDLLINQTTTTSETTLTVPIPVQNDQTHTNRNVNLTFLDTSTSNVQTYITFFRTFMSWALWIGFAIWLVNLARGKSISTEE